jgi:hypothetical protein
VDELETRLLHLPCGLAACLFSEMSPACFRPAFDGIGEVWLDGCAKKRNNRSAGSPQALVYVQTPAPFHFNRLAVEPNCYRVPAVVNNVENDGAGDAETS